MSPVRPVHRLGAFTAVVLLCATCLHAEPAEKKKSPGPVVRVACVGDSITAGWGMKDPERHSYPTRMRQLLGDGYEVVNFGSPGASVCPSTEPAKNPWHHTYTSTDLYPASLAFEPHVVVIALGANDLVDWAAQAERFVPDYVKLVERYQALPTKPRVVLWHRMAPIFDPSPFARKDDIAAINQAIGRVAKATGAQTIDLYGPLKDSPKLFLDDGVHPNPDGAAEIARVVAAAVRDEDAKRDGPAEPPKSGS